MLQTMQQISQIEGQMKTLNIRLRKRELKQVRQPAPVIGTGQEGVDSRRALISRYP
jgi:hypothetical protein